jgi:pimeloyl-ACP methyl ester carboxylesterase
VTTAMEQPPRHRRLRRPLLAAVVLLLLAATGTVLLRGVALLTVADGLGLDPPRPWAREVDRSREVLGGVVADRYAPVPTTRPGRLPQATTVVASRADARPAILLLPGAAPAGRDDRRVIAIATAIARADRVVVVPELEVYGEQLLPSDVDLIAEVALALAREQPGVVLAGLSFGGSLGLLAAADPRLEGDVRLVATFGAYADLAGVIQAVTTGVSLVDGQPIGWTPDPRAADVVREQLLALLEPPDRTRVSEALDGDLDPDVLEAELRAVHDLLTDPDPSRTMVHLASSPSQVQERIAEISPVRTAAALEVPLVTLHAVDDPIIPVGEQRRLAATYPQARVQELATFDHVGLDDDDVGWWVTARDLWRTAGFLQAVLDAR